MKQSISCDPQLRVSNESEYYIWYKVFHEKADFMTITLFQTLMKHRLNFSAVFC